MCAAAATNEAWPPARSPCCKPRPSIAAPVADALGDAGKGNRAARDVRRTPAAAADCVSARPSDGDQLGDRHLAGGEGVEDAPGAETRSASSRLR
jgi:hypothetical protein